MPAESEDVQLPKEGMRALFGGMLEIRSTESGGLGTLAGYISRYNEWTEIDSALEGHFMERVVRGAFRKTFQEGVGRIRCIFHHGQDPSVGVRALGPVEVLEEREDGAWAEVPLIDTSYNRDLAPGIAAGLYGMSFRFRAVRQEVNKYPGKSAHNPRGIQERTLTELAIPEFGPTPFAAYAGATAGMRSVTDDITAMKLRAVVFDKHWLESASAPAAAPAERVEEAHGSAFLVTEARTAAAGPSETRVVREALYARSISFAATHPWEMQPEVLAVVQAILKERASGGGPDEEEIKHRLALGGAIEDGEDPVPVLDGPVAVIPVMGPIMPRASMFSMSQAGASVDQMQQQFREALANENVQHIVFNVDSPGGSSAMIAELTQEIADARGQKPITAVANSLMASAAYHLMAQADDIAATPSADVGSIGVYAMHQDLTAAQEKLGRKVTLVQSEGSPYKTEFSPFVELSDEAAADMQRRVDEVYDTFVESVASGRGTTVEDVRENYGKGRVLSAKEALAAGMVDSVETFDQVLARLNAKYAPPEESAPAEAAARSEHRFTARCAGLDPKTLRTKENPKWLL